MSVILLSLYYVLCHTNGHPVSCALGDTTQAPTATTSANPFAPFPEETDHSKNDFEEHSNSDGGADGCVIAVL